MTQTLGLSDGEIKITITEYDRIVMDKVGQMGNTQREIKNSKKESKGNTRNQKHVHRNKKCLLWAHQ